MTGSAKLKPSVRLAVLGLVLQRPSWGYELVARFDRAFADQPWPWRVTPQAIYGALADLEADDLIEHVDADDLIAHIEDADARREASAQRGAEVLPMHWGRRSCDAPVARRADAERSVA